MLSKYIWYSLCIRQMHYNIPFTSSCTEDLLQAELQWVKNSQQNKYTRLWSTGGWKIKNKPTNKWKDTPNRFACEDAYCHSWEKPTEQITSMSCVREVWKHSIKPRGEVCGGRFLMDSCSHCKTTANIGMSGSCAPLYSYSRLALLT